jgi:hypothetical protein
MQCLRGRLYLADGAILPSDLDPSGRHVQAVDLVSWHLLALNPEGRVVACTRFRRHPSIVSWKELNIRHAPLAHSEEWGSRFRASIASELAAARAAGFSYVEVGGWAISEEIRGTSTALKTVLATYAWSQLLGGALGITTATERNESAGILRRLGGRPLAWNGVELPPYYDDRYRCRMEVLRFDSRRPNPKYLAMIEELRLQVATTPVITAPRGSENWHRTWLPPSIPVFESEIAC